MNFRQGELAFRQDFSEFFARELRPTAAMVGVLVDGANVYPVYGRLYRYETDAEKCF